MRAVDPNGAGGIAREAVDSSVIQAMGYDADLALLEIEFVSGIATISCRAGSGTSCATRHPRAPISRM